ncbi:homeobox protein cut-like 2 [Engraulis encrasicolus]|uniref:homeobox protein cut-like 2 n=1 Tax=Engraulis encrasicolus TaxID=184585 RepID=UPI002FCE9F62
MLEERQMKLQDPFPSHGTAAAAAGAAAAAAAAGKASSRQLDGQLNGSSCLDGQEDPEERMVPSQQSPASPSSPVDPSGHRDQCQTQQRHDQTEMPFSLRLAKAEERIRSLQSALTTSQSEVLNLQRQYDEERCSRSDF